MAKNEMTTVVVLIPRKGKVRFYGKNTEGEYEIEEKSVMGEAWFDEIYFSQLTDALTEYAKDHPQAMGGKTAVLLPTHTVGTDTVSVPAIRKKLMQNSLSVALTSAYKNSEELLINTMPVVQNRQYASYAVTYVKKSLIASVKAACAAAKLPAEEVTYRSSATVNGMLALYPRVKNANFLLVDVKDGETNFAFSVKGRTAGSYSLPIGYEILDDTKVLPEDRLIDHDVAHLAVLNAKEKARAKQLTILLNERGELGEDGKLTKEQLENTKLPEETASSESIAEETRTPTITAPAEEEYYEGEEQEAAMQEAERLAEQNAPKVKVGQRKPRRLPKFMQRPIPETPEGFVYENFRYIVKWALNLIQRNERITAQGAPETVYVNIPKQYRYLIDMVNAEKEENGISFHTVDVKEGQESLLGDLDLFGGLYAGQFNKNNNF